MKHLKIYKEEKKKQREKAKIIKLKTKGVSIDAVVKNGNTTYNFAHKNGKPRKLK